MERLLRRLGPWTGALVVLYGTLAAALFAFVVYRSSVLVASSVDVNCFGQISRNLLQGKGFSFGYGPTVRRAPLYPYFGAALLKLGGRDPHGYPDAEFYRPILLANCLLFGATCWCVWRLTRHVFGPRAALLAVAICPFIPQSLRYVGMTEVETMTAFLVAAMAATGYVVAARPSLGTGAAFGVAVALGTLSKPIVMLYPFVFLPFVAWHWKKQGAPTRARVLAAAALLACFALPLVPWSLRNMSVTEGRFKGVSSNGPGEFLRGYINAQPKYYLLQQNFGGNEPNTEKWDPEANAYEDALLRPHGIPFGQASFDSTGTLVFNPPPPPGKSSALVETEKDRIESAEMKRLLVSKPGAFVAKFLVQLGTFWYIVETRAKSVFVGAISLTMLGFAALGVMQARRRSVMVWPIVLVIAYHNAIYAAFLAFARYSMPLFPTLLVLSSGGMLALLDRFIASPRRAASSDVPAEQ